MHARANKGLGRRRLRSILFLLSFFGGMFWAESASTGMVDHPDRGFWSEFWQKMEVDGFLKNESSVRNRRPFELTKIENTFQLELTYHHSSQVELFTTLRTFYDAVWDLEDDLNRTGRKNLIADFDLREAYLDLFLDWADLRIGRQQVIWGQADGLKTLDVINPQDFKEFILDDFEDSRIPLWLIKLDAFLGDYTLELLWVPDLRFNELVRGSEFDFFRPLPPPSLRVEECSPVEPAKTLQNGEWGARLAWKQGGWDLTLNYFYNYEDFPIVFRQFSRDPITRQPILILKPRHTRFHILGGTFAKALGQLVMRGEATYNLNRYFSTTDPRDRDGMKKKDQMNYVVAFDYDIPRHHLFLSTQLFQRILPAHERGLVQDRIESIWSLLGRLDFLHENLLADFLLLYGINDAQAHFRTRLAYKITDAWKVTVGMDLFEGERNEFFGQFDSRDRFNFKLEYNF